MPHNREFEEITDCEIRSALIANGWDHTTADEGRLMLLELLAKASAGCYNSYTEEGFLREMQITTSTRKPNKKGYKFILSMVYASSRRKPSCYDLMKQFRN